MFAFYMHLAKVNINQSELFNYTNIYQMLDLPLSEYELLFSFILLGTLVTCFSVKECLSQICQAIQHPTNHRFVTGKTLLSGSCFMLLCATRDKSK